MTEEKYGLKPKRLHMHPLLSEAASITLASSGAAANA